MCKADKEEHIVVNQGKDKKRAAIIDVAQSVVLKHGIRKTTLEDVAVAAGMATTSIYYYFPSKNELLRDVIGNVIARTLEELRALTSAVMRPEDKLVETWKLLFSVVKQNGFLLTSDPKITSEVMVLAADLIRNFEKQYTQLIHSIISEGIDQGIFAVDDIEFTCACRTLTIRREA